MSATVGDFIQRVSRAIRRGTKYDEDIPGYAADAVRELEDMENWKYMWKEFSNNMVTSTTNNHLLLNPSSEEPELKNVRFLKIISDAGDEIPLRKTQRENVLSITSGRPGAFWMAVPGTSTVNRIAMDAYPNNTYAFKAGVFQYSERPLVNSCAWFTLAEDLLIARTIRKMQPLLRDDKLVQRWAAIEDSRMPALQEAQLVLDYDGADDKMTPFTYEVEEDIAEEVSFS